MSGAVAAVAEDKGRNSRQAGFFPPAVLDAQDVTVIGVGAIGRQVAHQLASVGIGTIRLYDHDLVEEVNLGPQGWSPEDIGKSKVTTCAQEIGRFSPSTVLSTSSRYPIAAAADNTSEVVFSCVDSIDTRRNLFNALKGHCKLFIDGRMASDMLHVLTVNTKSAEDLAMYEKSLFEQREAFVGSCTTKSSVYTANIIAGLMVCNYSKWLRGMIIPRPQFFLDLGMMDLFSE